MEQKYSRKVIVATTAIFITFANAIFNPAGLSNALAALLAGLTTSYTAGNVLAGGNDRPEIEKMYSTKFIATMTVMIFLLRIGFIRPVYIIGFACSQRNYACI